MSDPDDLEVVREFPRTVRLGLVEAIRARIAAGEYHQNTLEGDLAINLVGDKLTEKLKGNE